MSLGTGILLSSFLFAILILFIITKDRWKWKKILLWIMIIIIVIPVSIFVGSMIYDKYYLENHARNSLKPVQSFEDLSIGATKNDVKFLKGEPKITNQLWEYSSWNPFRGGHHITILWSNENKIREIAITFDKCLENCTEKHLILNIWSSHTYKDIIERLGEPSEVFSSPDDLRRHLIYKKYNVSFGLVQNEILMFSIYDPKLGYGLGLKDSKKL